MDIITPTNKINFVVDATLLTSIMKCGRFADFTHNQQLQSINGKSNSLECGSIVHKYLEVYYGSLKKGLRKPDAHGFGLTAAELYIQGCPDCTNFESTELQSKPKCGHPINDYPGVKNTPAEPSKDDKYTVGWKWVLDTCQQYYEHYSADYWVTLDVEVVKSKILYEDNEIRILFKSKLDWVVDTNQAILSTDHKTMKQNRDNMKLNNQFMGQCLMMDSRQVIVNKIGFQKTLKPVDKFKRESVSYTAAQLFEWQSITLPYWCKIAIMYEQTGYYPPNYTNCDGKFGYCQFYKEVCTSNPDMRGEALRLNFIKGPVWNPQNTDE